MISIVTSHLESFHKNAIKYPMNIQKYQDPMVFDPDPSGSTGLRPAAP